MGLFSGISDIVGGAAGADDQAPDILDSFRPRDIFGGLQAGGLRFNLTDDNRLVVKRGPGQRRARRSLRNIEGRSTKVARGFQRDRKRLQGVRRNLVGLRNEVRPGFGRLTEARVKAIERAEERATGNLREQFGARNVLGSSFAAREEAGLVAEFGEREEEARAQAIIEEIGTTLNIDKELLNVSAGQRAALAGKLKAIQTRLGAVQTRLQADLAEAGLAANIQNNVMDLAARIATAQANLEAQAAADRGAALAGIGGGVDQIIGGSGSLFGEDFTLFGEGGILT